MNGLRSTCTQSVWKSGHQSWVRNLLAKIQLYVKVNGIKPKSVSIPNLASGFTNCCSVDEILISLSCLMRPITTQDESISNNHVSLMLHNYFIYHAVLIFGAQD